jgi:hypothetical protein
MKTTIPRRSVVSLLAATALCPAVLLAQPVRRRTRGDAINDDLFQRLPPSAEAHAIWIKYYRSELRPQLARRTGISNEALEDLYADLSTVVFYTAAPAAAKDMRLGLEELAHRGLATGQQTVRLYDCLYGARLLEDAELIRARYALPALPRMRVAKGVNNGTPAHIMVVQGRDEVFAVRSELPAGPLVIMVASPACGWSNRAVAEIEGNPLLKARLAKVMRLMTPHEMGFHLDSLQQWNREHPAFPMTMAYHQQGWPMLDLGYTPQFYFFRDGKVWQAMPRWPEGGAVDIMDALRRIGA